MVISKGIAGSHMRQCQVKQLAAALARCKGLEEGEVTGQVFGKLSLTLMRGNAQMISSRCQDADYPPAEIDGVQ